MIGTQQTGNNQYSLTVHSSSVYNKNPKKNDVCKAYLASSLSVLGENRSIKEKQIDADLALEKTVRELKDVNKSFYIISENDNSRFIEISEKGFEVYDSLIENGQRVDHMVINVARDDINYTAELQRYMDTMYDKAIVESIEDLGKHLAAGDLKLEKRRKKKSKDAVLVSKANREITNKINEMIKTRHKDRTVGFKEYEKEAAEILECLQNDKVPEKYSLDDMTSLKEIYTSKEMKIPNFDDVIGGLTDRGPTIKIEKAEKINKEIVKESRKVHENTDRQGKE